MIYFLMGKKREFIGVLSCRRGGWVLSVEFV